MIILKQYSRVDNEKVLIYSVYEYVFMKTYLELLKLTIKGGCDLAKTKYLLEVGPIPLVLMLIILFPWMK
jgi:hypothetical protein